MNIDIGISLFRWRVELDHEWNLVYKRIKVNGDM